MLRTLTDSILSLAYPEDCKVCHNEVESSDDGVACSDCWRLTRIFDGTETLCSKCGAFLFEGAGKANAFCRRCDEHYYDAAAAVGLYERALSASVLSLKGVPRVSGKLRRLFTAASDRLTVDPSTLIVPVPLSPLREFERGFNQASVLARIISRYAGVRVDEHTLARRKHTPMHRAGMDRKARAMTVKSAFEVVRGRLVEGRTILLVDDVFTSGETASICAKVLKKSGAARVDVLTLARAA